MKTMYLVSLGCPKNLVDSEVMLAALEQDGYAVVDDPEQADLLLVNTCGFIRPAVEEAIDTILDLARYKAGAPGKRLVATGCMVQRYGAELAAELPEVDLFVGLDDFPEIGRLLQTASAAGRVVTRPGAARYLMDRTAPRRVSTPPHRSYLKITEGCDNRCSYCMIPAIRGRLRSRPVEDLVAEARSLERSGVRELSLIAQDLTAYGRDFGQPDALVDLLKNLLDQTAIPWFRLLYLYPSGVSEALLKLMATQPRILPYLDIPFQHVSDRVLHRMHRHYGAAILDELVARIRGFLPECAIRTTMLVGFPGETEADVEQLIEALERWQLDHVGVFPYEDEEGSAAYELSGKIEEEEKAARYRRVMEAQATISRNRLGRFVGRTEQVLIEGVSRESELLLEGRTRFQAPDIDGCVLITAGQVNSGDLVPVRITEAHVYDLVGEVVDGEAGSAP
jgi:ribosomal protein S12 methylthiotransferase